MAEYGLDKVRSLLTQHKKHLPRELSRIDDENEAHLRAVQSVTLVSKNLREVNDRYRDMKYELRERGKMPCSRKRLKRYAKCFGWSV